MGRLQSIALDSYNLYSLVLLSLIPVKPDQKQSLAWL